MKCQGNSFVSAYATSVPSTEFSRLKTRLSGSKDHTPIIQKVSRFMADLGQVHTYKHVQF